MTSLAPCSLKYLAADKYLSEVSTSSLFKSLDKRLHMFRSCLEQLCPAIASVHDFRPTHIKDIMGNFYCQQILEMVEMTWVTVQETIGIEEVDDDDDEDDAAAAAAVLAVIKERVQHNCMRDETGWADFFLQLLFSDTLFVQRYHRDHFHIFQLVNIQCPNLQFRGVTTIVTPANHINGSMLETTMSMFPNTRVFKATLTLYVNSIQTALTDIEELELRRNEEQQDLSDDEWCKIFFDDLNYAEVTRKYVGALEVPLSFKKLKKLTLPLKVPRNIKFLSHMIHYYPEVDLEWLTENCNYWEPSAFEYAVFHNIDSNPGHHLRHCSLRFDDLRHRFVDELLLRWRHLDSLTLYANSCADFVNFDDAQIRLETILLESKNLTTFQVVTEAEKNGKSFNIVYKCIEKCGHKLTKLSIIDKVQLITHKDIVHMLNCCPNLQFLRLSECPHSRYSRDVKLKPLLKLEYFRCMFFARPQLTKSQGFTKLIPDILKAAPGCTHLECNIDAGLLFELSKIKFNENLRHWAVYTYLSPDITSLLKMLINVVRKMYVKTLAMSDVKDNATDDAMVNLMMNIRPHRSPALEMNCLVKNTELKVEGPYVNQFYHHISGFKKL